MGNMMLSEIAKSEGYSKYKKMTITTATTYNVMVTDYLIEPEASINNITYTLPPKTTFSGGGVQELIIINNVISGNSITVKCSSGDTFIHGNTEYILPSNMGDAHFLLKSSGYLISDDITTTIMMNVHSVSVMSTVIYDNVIVNTQPEFFSANTTTGEIKILTSGLYDIYLNMETLSDTAWGLSGGTYQNGYIINGTVVTISNSFKKEGVNMQKLNCGIPLEKGDVISVRMFILTGSPYIEYSKFMLRLQLE